MTKDMSLARKIDQLGQSVAKRESAKVYQFPLWGDPQRGVPNDFARSALFAATHPKNRNHLTREPIFSQNGISVTYTGIRLSQSHLDVFEAIMHLAREMPEGNTVRFSTHGLLKLIGRSTGKTDHERLLRTLEELTATAVTIKHEGHGTYCGSLLPEWANREENGKFSIRINRDIIKLFEHGFTVIEWEQRKALTRKPLAQALHVWLCSHENPYPATVQYLHDITGSNTKELKRFRQSLKAALDELKSIGVLTDWHLDERDKMHFIKA